MRQIAAICGVGLEHILVPLCVWFWPSNKDSEHRQKEYSGSDSGISYELRTKAKIMYENLITGLMMGMAFFFLLPLSDLLTSGQPGAHSQRSERAFPLGSLISIVLMVLILVSCNYLYHSNYAIGTPGVERFRSRNDFEHNQLSNNRLRLRRRLAISGIRTQLLVSMPSVLSTSVLVAATHSSTVWFWSLVLVLFRKYEFCHFLAKAHQAAAFRPAVAFKFAVAHSTVNVLYLLVAIQLRHIAVNFVSGVLIAISCGAFLYDVFVERLPNNYDSKKHLSEKVLFLICGIFLSLVVHQFNQLS